MTAASHSRKVDGGVRGRFCHKLRPDLGVDVEQADFQPEGTDEPLLRRAWHVF